MLLLYLAVEYITHASPPVLFMDTSDAHEPWGLLRPVANSVALAPDLHPPPLDYARGAIVFGVLGSAALGFEVYAVNSTGPEPVGSRSSKKKKLTVNVLRFVTMNFKTYTAPSVCLTFETNGDPYPFTMPTVKSIARDANDPKGATLMAVFGDGINMYISTDGGVSFAPTEPGVPPKPNFDDKDDINIMWSQNRWVDMQITKQNWTLKYCDNLKGCDHRRVISARNSTDGVSWSNDLGLRVPDAVDPPEVQFYRIRPFYLGDSNRLAAHVLLYAPAPWIGPAYGRQPPNCDKENKTHCHGPHLYEEWWIGPLR